MTENEKRIKRYADRTPEQIARDRQRAKDYQQNRSAASKKRKCEKQKIKRAQRTDAQKEQDAKKVKEYQANRVITDDQKAKRKEQVKAWDKANKQGRTEKEKQEQRDKHKEWRQTTAGAASTINSISKRRHKKIKQSDGTLPFEIEYPLTADLHALLEGQKHKCNDCGCTMTKEVGEQQQHLDHHEPLSKGGAHSISNVVWLCRTCNLTKSATVPTAPLTMRIAAA